MKQKAHFTIRVCVRISSLLLSKAIPSGASILSSLVCAAGIVPPRGWGIARWLGGGRNHKLSVVGPAIKASV